MSIKQEAVMSALDSFALPNRAKIAGRSSVITHAFASGVIPSIMPTEEEVREALEVLGMDEDRIVCAYCGDTATEWDHLNAIIKDKQPTGYFTEIHNLVPACGKCNQSKRNQPWREWITGPAKLSPKTRGVPDLESRIARLEAYERAFVPRVIDFEAVVGEEEWGKHWANCESIKSLMRDSQVLSDEIASTLQTYAESETL